MLDRSIFMHLSWLVLEHLCYVSLVILVFKGIFCVFSYSKGKVCKKMHFGAFWSKIGLGMVVTCLEQKE